MRACIFGRSRPRLFRSRAAVASAREQVKATQVCHAALVDCEQERKRKRPGCSQRRRPSMCDYSLHNVATRPAKVGDKLVTTSFANSCTRGFAAVGYPNVAVCLLPGTELALDKEVQCDHAFGRLWPSLRSGNIEEKVARFRQVNIAQPNAHRDAPVRRTARDRAAAAGRSLCRRRSRLPACRKRSQGRATRAQFRPCLTGPVTGSKLTEATM